MTYTARAPLTNLSALTKDDLEEALANNGYTDCAIKLCEFAKHEEGCFMYTVEFVDNDEKGWLFVTVSDSGKIVAF